MKTHSCSAVAHFLYICTAVNAFMYCIARPVRLSFAFQYICAISYLPHELQVQIIKAIPESEWFKVPGIEFSECGLHEKSLWKNLDADDFGELDANIVKLLKICAY